MKLRRKNLLINCQKPGKVVFRRNNKIKWGIETFTIKVNEIKILNPLVSYAFKITTKNIEEKDLKDIRELTNYFGQNF